jgi:O-acetyl-ADP-ribose deacetylase (regulator of RNase III)
VQIPLKKYANAIQLQEVYSPMLHNAYSKVDLVDDLLEILTNEQKQLQKSDIPSDYNGRRSLLKGLLTVRNPDPLKDDFISRIDTLLQMERKEKGNVEVEKLETVATMIPSCSLEQSNKIILWQGDITRLAADAIVNAANQYLLGCFQPYHACIDNAIHSAAGPQLREDCSVIMSLQGELEATGGSKITRGYNLPAKFVLHTVGPIVSRGTNVSEHQRTQLADCYRSCLALANEIKDIKSVAFCAVSTGVFGFPKAEAAKIAVQTVNEWLSTNAHHIEKVVFNVFSEEDHYNYLDVLRF